MRIPFLRPTPPALSELVPELRAIEASGIFTNYGPVNTRLEKSLTDTVFGGQGECLTTNCATTGLIMAIREASRPGREYALMPSFTFAATAHAAIWAGLRPLLADIDRETWALSEQSVKRLLETYGDRIACVVPYAPFGNSIDLDFYDRIASKYDIGIVVDAAGSIGTLNETGRNFGAGFPHAVVFSMHATKLFATAEGGIIHCGDIDRLDRLRAMGNFGFTQPRIATMPGLNAKLSEIGALLGLARLRDIEGVVAARLAVADRYKSLLPEFTFQRLVGRRVAYMFMPALLPPRWASRRKILVDGMARRGIGLGQYFSPHLAEHPFFASQCVIDDLSVTQDIAGRMLSLPMSDAMTAKEVAMVCSALVEEMEFVA